MIGYWFGMGKYKGKMGFMLVWIVEGLEFYIGSGFSDVECVELFKIGSVIIYCYNGFIMEGKLRFVCFVWVRENY